MSYSVYVRKVESLLRRVKKMGAPEFLIAYCSRKLDRAKHYMVESKSDNAIGLGREFVVGRKIRAISTVVELIDLLDCFIAFNSEIPASGIFRHK